MKSKRKEIISLTGIIVSAMIPFVAFAGYDIRLLCDDYDFGIMKEAAGPKTGIVKLVNNGPDATYIRQVRPSCGCTDADFKEGMIAPGDTAWVSFTYNPKGRPGPFSKTVKVYTGDDERKHVITIHGTVIGTPETLSVNYPFDFGDIRLSDKAVDLGNIRQGSVRHLFINAYNQSQDSVEVQYKSPSGALDVDIYPKKPGPGELATFSFYLNTRELSPEDVGDRTYEIPLYIPSKGEEPIGTISVKAKIIPNAEGLTSSAFASSPRLSLPSPVIAIENIRAGKSADFSMTIENTGKSTLKIINIIPGGENVVIKKFPSEIKADGEGVIKGRFTMSTDKPIRIPVEIYSNDPVHPTMTIYVTANPGK